MKKKIYFQDSIPYHILFSIPLIIGIATITFAVVELIHSPSTNLYLNIFLIFAGLYCFYVFLDTESFIIHMDDKKVWMIGEPVIEPLRTQYKAEVLFSDIINIYIVRSHTNSKGKKYENRNRKVRLGIRAYLVFTKKNGHKVRMLVSYHTREHLLEIISEIIIRINATGNIYEGNDPLWIVNHIK